ncbi:MAG: M23 family peptidase [Chloroflexi bacterium]|nr:MAG: M23 family peptidase [Chloroflexota bacterium]
MGFRADFTESRWSRRQLLRVALGAGATLPLAALLGCTRQGVSVSASPSTTTATTAASSATPTLTATPPPTPSPTPTPAHTPVPLTIAVLPATLGTGEAMRLEVAMPAWASDAKGTFRFDGKQYALARRADGSLWGIVGASLDRSPSTSVPLTVEAQTSAGLPIGTGSRNIAIVAVQRPIDYLQVTEEQGAVLGGDAGPREEAIRQQQFASFDPVPPRWSGLFLRPTDGETTTQFGWARSINNGPVGAGHTGTDLANDTGTPVQLAAAGRVIWAGPMPIRGNAVVVDHGGGVKSGYHHLSAINVAVGDTVLAAGTVVGLVGSTGFATGPHLHWEVTVWGTNVDAMTWLTVPFGT